MNYKLGRKQPSKNVDNIQLAKQQEDEEQQKYMVGRISSV